MIRVPSTQQNPHPVQPNKIRVPFNPTKSASRSTQQNPRPVQPNKIRVPFNPAKSASRSTQQNPRPVQPSKIRVPLIQEIRVPVQPATNPPLHFFRGPGCQFFQ
jgi:hypothetical protein